ncbi:MAG: M14 family metallocarboxypeptidase [Verrucomicrobiaceae bacterium]
MSLASQRSHDYALLVQNWRKLAAKTGLKFTRFATVEGLSVFTVASPSRRGDTRETIYLSAGVHGDEAAPPWGLLEWAEENTSLFRSHRFLIFPCFNPHGLMHNTRVDQRGVDINRTFHDEREPLIAAWKKILDGRTISVAMCLHEDYDAQGCYIYELTSRKENVGARILRECSGIIPTDRRSSIDGRRMKNGHFVRRVAPEMPGVPEAIALHNIGAPVSLTFESPSEFSLMDRVAVQKKFIQSALHHVLGI